MRIRLFSILLILLRSLFFTRRRRKSPKPAKPASNATPFHSRVGGAVAIERARQKGRRLLFLHQADAKDPATFEHYGYKIAVIVTPNYCARCHARRSKQFEKSHHAAAAQFIGFAGQHARRNCGRRAAANNGCRQCHGSEVSTSVTGASIPPPGQQRHWPRESRRQQRHLRRVPRAAFL